VPLGTATWKSQHGIWKLKNVGLEDLTMEYKAVYYTPFHSKWQQSDNGLGEFKVEENKGIVLNRRIGGERVKWYATVYIRKNWYNWNTMQWAKLSSLQKRVNIAQWKAQLEVLHSVDRKRILNRGGTTQNNCQSSETLSCVSIIIRSFVVGFCLLSIPC
jgi:hypothetical protein